MKDQVISHHELLIRIKELELERDTYKALYDESIRQQKENEAILRQSEKNLSAIINSTKESIVLVASDDTIVALNEVVAQRLGRDRDELIGQKASEIFPPEVLATRRPFFQQALKTGEQVIFEDVRDGRWMISNIYPIRNLDGKVDRLAFFSRDVTESKKAEKALIESEEKYRRLFDTASLGIFQSTPEGQAISVNPAFVRMFGYDSIEDALNALTDVSTQLFVDPNRRSEIIRLMQMNPELKTFENEYRRKDGTSFLGQLTSFPIREPNGKIIRIEGIIEDITERKRAEERIRKKGAQLQRMNAEKDKFFSIIAHDLRSPFNALLGLTELMAEDLPDMTFEETQKMVFALRNTANKLVHLVDNLLEWSRAQRGQTNPVAKPLRLIDEVGVCVDQVQPTADKKRIMIQTDINENMMVEADPQMFGSLLRNLVFNAVKFTPKGGEILIFARADHSDLVEVAVRDNGIGMSQEVVDRLFCVDGDIRRNGTEGESGSGLGLILCKEYVEKHGGQIWLESIPGKGSTFHFTIPGH